MLYSLRPDLTPGSNDSRMISVKIFIFKLLQGKIVHRGETNGERQREERDRKKEREIERGKLS